MLNNVETRVGFWNWAGLAAVAIAATAPARAEITPNGAVKDAQACMVQALRATPGFIDAQAQSIGGSDRDLLLIYRLRASSGQIFNRRVEVYQEGPRRFSIYMTEGLTPDLFGAWHTCGVTTVQPPSS